MSSVNVTPAQIAGADPARVLSPEAQDVLERLKDYYRNVGKPKLAQNYGRHLRVLFSWAEGRGYSVHALPPTAVEEFLSDLLNAGQKATTTYLVRGQLKASLRAAHESLGIDFAHIEYQTGKPPEVRQAQKAKAREKKAAARAETDAARQTAIAAAQAVYAAHTPGEGADAALDVPLETAPMSDTYAPAAAGVAPTAPPAAAAQTPTVVVMNAPPQQRQMTTIGQGPRQPVAPASSQPARGITISNHVFTGPWVKISRISDGSEPFIPPGTEQYVTTQAAAQLVAHGDIGDYLQRLVLPTIPLRSSVTSVQFVFYELNDKRQPTGRRDELVISVPMGGASSSVNGSSTASASQGPSFDRATEYLLKKLDQDADAAKRRADELQEQLRSAKDAQTTFLLTQQMERERELKRELEERKERELARALTPAPTPAPAALPFNGPLAGFPAMSFDPPKADTSLADAMRAMAEQNAKTLEVLATAMRPAPVAAQKDTSEWLVPFMSQMNQQAQAQSQAQQQMMLTLMQTQQAQSQQASQQMMQLMLSKESATEKILLMQLQKAEAQANAPKGDEVEDFAEKLQKMKMVTDMLGGGGGSSFISDIFQNMDTIGAGAAQIIAAAKGGAAAPGPTRAVLAEQQQLMGQAQQQTPQLPPKQKPEAQRPVEPPKPTPAMLEAHAVLVKAAEARDEKAVADGFVKLMVELSTAQEPFVGMARRVLAAFETAEDEGELYTLAKNLYIVVGAQPFRPVCKYLAKVFARWYSPLHQAFFDVPKELPANVEDADVSDSTSGPQAATQQEAAAPDADLVDDGEDDEEDDGEDGDDGDDADGEAA